MRGPIFDEFSIGKKSAKIAVRSGKNAKKERPRDFEGRVGGGGAARGGS